MNLNSTPLAQRIHIGLFGRRNAGKSSLINALTGQALSIVSDMPGTTTDPVSKAMELLPLGPVVFIDTPGLDDEGELGQLRVRKAYQMLNKVDLALLVLDATLGLTAEDEQILAHIKEKRIPYLIVRNKIDICHVAGPTPEIDCIDVSAVAKINIDRLKEKIAALTSPKEPSGHIIGDLVQTGDLALLVVPIDSAAPKGRLILPQQQTIRDLIDSGAMALVVKDTELEDAFYTVGTSPKVVITDSQVFHKVAPLVPKDVFLTSFSILMARYKGNLAINIKGAQSISNLKDGDTLLISEGCTHHRQCEDIGTVKLPRLLEKFTGAKLHYLFTSGGEFPSDLTPYKLIIHCGGCTLNEREMKYRLQCAEDAGVPMTNYGTAIAYMNGILERSTELFPEISKRGD